MASSRSLARLATVMCIQVNTKLVQVLAAMLLMEQCYSCHAMMEQHCLLHALSFCCTG